MRLKFHNKNALGRLAEQVTKKHLLKKGLEFVVSNYRKPFGEIDLIMKRSGRIYFFEVKSVSREMSHRLARGVGRSDTYRPEDNAHPHKLRKLSRVIKVWLSENDLDESCQWSFNVVLVYFSRRESKFWVKILWNVIL